MRRRGGCPEDDNDTGANNDGDYDGPDEKENAAVAALAWELGGHSAAAPALATLLVAVDAYVLRADDAATRTVAVVSLDDVEW